MNIFDFLRSLVKPKPVEPVALQMLHDFNGFAAKIDAFRNAPNEGAKYLYLRDHGPFPTNEYLGITPGWINAVDGEGLLNGKTVRSFRGDPNTAAFTWVSGSPPSYYQAPGPLLLGDGRHTLEKYLMDMANASSYLRGLGLTPEAVASAAGHEK